jgi:hypothetical protein
MATLDSLRSNLGRPDQLRHALQAPLASLRFCIVYRRDGIEHVSPWMHSRNRANRALTICARRYGQAAILID